MPEQFRKYILLLKEDGKKILKGYIWAQLQIMFCVFLLLSVGFSILNVEFAVPLAFLTAFLDALPVFGVGFIMWPWMALVLLKGKFLLFLALLVIYLLSQMIRQILQPKIIGDAVGLPPLLALVFLFLGYKFYGISGMVLALPVGMLLVRFYHYGAFSGFFSSGKALGKMLWNYAEVKNEEIDLV
jgi:sporulation integral membrane protein ytvI